MSEETKLKDGDLDGDDRYEELISRISRLRKKVKELEEESGRNRLHDRRMIEEQGQQLGQLRSEMDRLRPLAELGKQIQENTTALRNMLAAYKAVHPVANQ